MFPQQPANFQFSFQQCDKRRGEVSKVAGFHKLNANRWRTLKRRREMLASIQVKGVGEAPPYLITADLQKDVVWITQLKKKRSIWQSHVFRHKALGESYLTGLSAPIRPRQDVEDEPWHHFSKTRVWTFASSSSKHLSSYAQCLWLLLPQTGYPTDLLQKVPCSLN